MAVPAAVDGVGPDGGPDSAQEVPEDGQGEACSGLAEGRGGERLADQA